MWKTLRVAHPTLSAFRSSNLIRVTPQASCLSTRITKNAVAVAAVATHMSSTHDALKQLATSSVNNEPFFLLDIGDVYRKHRVWESALPRVDPFYAVKCNSDPLVLSSLASLGTGFDCASLVEMQTMISLGVDPKKIIYAHPCKPLSHIKFAFDHGVEMMTFDNEDEIVKIKAIHPRAKLVLRVHTDDSKALCKLGKKFGAPASETFELLSKAYQLGADVIGVSFHVGSGCFDASAFSEAIAVARGVFDQGARAGFQFSLLDVGGGFPGDKTAPVGFTEVTPVLNAALEKHFPASEGVRVIAEPGRYYVSSSGTLAVNVISKRKMKAEQAGELHSFFYYVNDGAYGTLNNVMYDHAEPIPTALFEHHGAQLFPSTLWGPTCDSMDCITRTAKLPELHIGDWITFHNSGAYTIAAGCTFNGFPRPRMVYTFSTPEDFNESELPASFPIAPSHIEP
jgi:ornithine decarboxylase